MSYATKIRKTKLAELQYMYLSKAVGLQLILFYQDVFEDDSVEEPRSNLSSSKGSFAFSFKV